MQNKNSFCASRIEAAKTHLIERVNPYLIYLFGSVVKNNLRTESDLDIAFLSDVRMSDFSLFMIAQELADICNRDVDLIDLSDASAVFKAQIVGNGNVIFCNDEQRRMYFEMRVLKEYALLNEERAKIMEKIEDRGRIYG